MRKAGRPERLALLAALLASSPALAQQGTPDPLIGPALAPDSAPSDPHRLTLADHPPGLARRGPVGESWPMAENVDIGVGLYSVGGTRMRERDFKRSDPMADVRPRTRRIAAIGLSLRF